MCSQHHFVPLSLIELELLFLQEVKVKTTGVDEVRKVVRAGGTDRLLRETA